MAWPLMAVKSPVRSGSRSATPVGTGVTKPIQWDASRGAFPADGPATLVAVRDAGGGDSENYLGTTTALLQPEAQVLVRAPQREDARQLAVRCWEAHEACMRE